jgi:hypothetical protein
MSEIANARIKTFGPSPEADEPVFEVPLSELEGLLEALVETHNQIAAVVQEAGILRGRELARVTANHTQALRAEKSPIMKIHLINIYIRRHVIRIREALKARPTVGGGKVVQVVSKIAARAVQIITHIMTLARDDPKRKDITLDSSHARTLFSGADGEQVSRKETIRAMRRAERLWPALECSHRPNDGRQTMRISARAEDVAYAPEVDHCFSWQRSGQSIGLSI